MEAWDPLIVTHALGATFSLVFGAVNLVREPKGDQLHRTLGRVYLALMYFTIFSSFGIQQLRPGEFSWIHGLSVFTFVTLTLGWSAGRRGNRPMHAAHMIGTYGGIWGAFIGAVAVPDRLLPLAFQDNWLGMTVLTAFVVGVGLAFVRALGRHLEARFGVPVITPGADRPV